MKRRDFLKIAGTGLAAFLVSGCGNPLQVRKIKPKRPNIIYILADDLGYGDLGCYGQKEIKTPNLDRMAAEGMRFTQHYAGSTVCAPSRCTLMTGQHTGHCLVRGNRGISLRPEDTTVAELLQESGYRTGLIGKWGVGERGTTGVPNKKGFDYFYGYLNQGHAHNHYPEFLWRNDEKVKLCNSVVRPRGTYCQNWTYGGIATRRVDYSQDLLTSEALQFVQRNKDESFFLYLAYIIPHANNEAKFLDRHGMEVPDYGIYKDKDWSEPRKGHAAMISWMDKDIGRLLEKLKELGIAQNTLVIFSSDNGSHKEGGFSPSQTKSSGSLRGIKRDLYEGGIRVPMIARWPGKVKAGSVSKHISAFWDFLPTACDAAKIEANKGIDGISFLPTLLGKNTQQKKHEYLYWEFHEKKSSEQAIRMGKWKALRHSPDAPIELYNLENDIGEAHNIAKLNPKIVKDIQRYFEAAHQPSIHCTLKK